MSLVAKAMGRYSSFAILLHWLIALGIVVMVVLGFTMVHQHLSLARKFQLYQLHKSVGVTVLLTAVIRLGWRLTHKPPALSASMSSAEKVAAHGGHFLLYVFLFVLPLTGWGIVSVAPLNIPTRLYGVIPWPHLSFLARATNKDSLYSFLKQVHAYFAWTMVAVVVGHLAAALKHHFIKHDDVLIRMLPWRRIDSPSVDKTVATP
jgi:cytochrome b561